jgi:hypothetical protein
MIRLRTTTGKKYQHKKGRSSSPVGYSIGIAEIVGSNPARSTLLRNQTVVNDPSIRKSAIFLLAFR